MFIFIVILCDNRFTILNFLCEKFITRYNWDYMYLKASIYLCCLFIRLESLKLTVALLFYRSKYTTDYCQSHQFAVSRLSDVRNQVTTRLYYYFFLILVFQLDFISHLSLLLCPLHVLPLKKMKKDPKP